MTVRFPEGLRLEPLRRAHRPAAFCSGQPAVDRWLSTMALQASGKHLSVTKALVDDRADIAGFYTLAPGQVDLGSLPSDLANGLPRRPLPTAVIAWLGVAVGFQRTGLAGRLLAAACTDLLAASDALPFVAVCVDCLDVRSRAFFSAFGFVALDDAENRLFLPRAALEAAIRSTK